MKAFKILNLVIVLVLLASLAFAGVTTVPDSDTNPVLCPRETGTFTDVIWNTGGATEQVSITLSGSAAKWANVAPNGFFLSPSEKKNVYTYVTPKSDAAPGNYELILNVNFDGEKKTIKHTVVVDKCFDASLSGDFVTQQVCPEGSAKYEVYLTNTGKFQEGFTLQVDGPAILNDNRAYLASGDTKTFYVYATAPKDEGDYGITVSAIGDSGKSVDTFDFALEVLPCYDFIVNIEGDNNYDICDHTLITVPINVKNIGTVQQKYDIDFDGANWGLMNKQELSLLPNAEEKLSLTFAPDYGVEGEFEFDLEIVPEYGDKKAISKFNFNIRDCNKVNLNISSTDVEVCNFGTPKQISAVVKNNGEFAKEYKLDIAEDVSWITVDGAESSKFSLDSGSEVTKTLFINPDLEVKVDDYSFTLGVGALDDSDEFQSLEFDVEVMGQGECYASEMNAQYDDVVVYRDSSVVLPLIVKNEGKETASYELSLTGTASEFVILNPATLTVEAGQETATYLYIAPNADTVDTDYFASIALNLVGSGQLDVEEVEIEITSDASKATPLGSEPGEELNTTSFWSGISGWFSNLFASNDDNITVVTETNSTENNETIESTFWNDAWQGVKDYRYYILGVIIVLLVIVILVRIGFFEKMTETLLDEEEVEGAKTSEQKEADEIKKAVSKKKVKKKVKKK